MKKIKSLFLTFISFLLIPISSVSSTLIIQPVEEVIKQSSLIVEARVVKIENFPIKGSALGYSLITLEINDFLKGDSKNQIIVKRFGIDENGKQLFGEYKPIFQVGERVIVCLIESDDEHYMHLGLYRGTFKVKNDKVINYDLDIAEFKEHVVNVVNGIVDKFPEPSTDPYSLNQVKKHAHAQNNNILLSAHGPHLNGQFVSYDETWDLSYLPLQFYYNPDNAPETTGTVLDRINDAFAVWNDLTFCELKFQTINTSHLTNSDQNNDDESVILWQSWTPGVLAQEFPYPEEQGVGTKVGSDVLLNTNYNNEWYFGSSPPSTRNLQQIDFVDVLIHELGHTQGLAHTNVSSTLMYGGGYENITVAPLRTISDGDMAGAIYQHTVPDISGLSDSFPHDIAVSHSRNQFTFGDDFTISSGHLLEISPGITFSFGSGDGLIADGELLIQGTSGSPVTLEPTGGSWAGVHLHGSGSSLSYTEIEDAVNGVSIFNTSNISLEEVEVSGSSSNGIHIVNSTNLSISDIRSEDNFLRGINLDGNNNSNWSGNVMKFNSDGLQLTGGATLTNLTTSRLSENWNGVVVRDGSTLSASTNSIHDNGGRHATSVFSSTVNAQSNWWGQAPPNSNKFYSDGTSSLNYSSWLSSDPIPGIQKRPANKMLLALADGTYHTENNRQETPNDIQTLADLRAALEESGRHFSGQLSILDNLASRLDEEVRPWGEIVRIELQQLLKNHTDAIRTGSLILEDLSTSEEIRRTAARRMFYSYLLGLDQPDRAAEMISLLKEMDDPETENNQLNWLLEFYSGEKERIAFMETAADDLSEEIPDELTLSNYPNPFNPVTIIRYQLPERSEVRLEVFDMLGRRVALLVDGQIPAGTHQATFDATSLSSGLYLYRLQTSADVLSGRMVLLK